ncbi:MAG: hypothetical protein AAGF97_14755 [Planctomycetota bacterium]
MLREQNQLSFPPLAWDVYPKLPAAIRGPLLRARYPHVWDSIPAHCPYLFLHVPKTGGTALATQLHGSGINHFPWWVWSVVDPKRFEASHKFSIIREPVDRFVSVIRHCLGAPRASAAERLAGDILREHGESITEMCHAFLTSASLRRKLRRVVHFKSQVFWINDGNQPVVDRLFALQPRTGTTDENRAHNVNAQIAAPPQVPAETRARIYELYADDVALYERVRPQDRVESVFEILPSLEGLAMERMT